MKKGWTEVALGELLSLDVDAVPVDPTASYPFAGVYGFGRGLFARDNVRGSDTTYSHFHRLHVGKLVMSQPKGWEGAITVVPKEFEGRFLSKVFPTFLIDDSRIDPGFLKWITKCKWLWDSLLDKSSGIGARRNSIYPDQLFEVQVPLPSLAEQHRIVAHLDAIEQRLKRIQKLREESEKELLAALRSTFHQIEADANWLEMGEVAPLVRREVDIEHSKSYREYGVKSFYKGIFLRRKMLGASYSWQKLFWLKEGDLVFSNIMAWEKAIGFASQEQDGWVGNHRMLVCETQQNTVLPSWLYYYFTTQKGFAEIEKASPGTAARNKTLKAASLEKIMIPTTSMEKQKQFKKLFNDANKIKDQHTKAIAKQEALLPSLLDSIFNS